jgi:hypothetical protein
MFCVCLVSSAVSRLPCYLQLPVHITAETPTIYVAGADLDEVKIFLCLVLKSEIFEALCSGQSRFISL